MRNRILVLFALISFMTIDSTYACDTKQQNVPASLSQGLGRIAPYMIEESSGWIGAMIGQIAGFTIPGLTGWFGMETEWSNIVFTQFFSGTIGATVGTVLTGKILGQEGSRAGAFIGSALGSLIAFSSLWIMGSHLGIRASWLGLYEPWFGIFPYFSTCISTGAVIGYNYKALNSNKMELFPCLVGCAATSIALNILVGQLTDGFKD